LNELEVFYLENRTTMKPAEMDAHFGYDSKRFEKIGYNIRKFYLNEKGLQPYHEDLIRIGQVELDRVGIRVTCRRLAEKHNVKEKTIRADYGHLKRYGKL